MVRAPVVAASTGVDAPPSPTPPSPPAAADDVVSPVGADFPGSPSTLDSLADQLAAEGFESDSTDDNDDGSTDVLRALAASWTTTRRSNAARRVATPLVRSPPKTTPAPAPPCDSFASVVGTQPFEAPKVHGDVRPSTRHSARPHTHRGVRGHRLLRVRPSTWTTRSTTP